MHGNIFGQAPLFSCAILKFWVEPGYEAEVSHVCQNVTFITLYACTRDKVSFLLSTCVYNYQVCAPKLYMFGICPIMLMGKGYCSHYYINYPYYMIIILKGQVFICLSSLCTLYYTCSMCVKMMYVLLYMTKPFDFRITKINYDFVVCT